jgi:hypothetical protein
MTWCQSCQAISFAESKREREPQYHWGVLYPYSTFAVLQPSWRALQKSAHHGCPLCSKFWAALSREGRWVIEDTYTGCCKGPQYGPKEVCNGGTHSVVLLCYHDDNDRDWLFNGVVFIVCGRNISPYRPKLPVPSEFSKLLCCDLLIILGHLMELFARSYASAPQFRNIQSDVATLSDDSTGSEVNLCLAKIWLQDCLLLHEKCTRGSALHSPPIFPSRVIDVADPGNCFLFENLGERDNYLTLSYCWGQGERLLTTISSYEIFRRRLPSDDQIPLTFRDAFTVTRALGHRYIWIDALCIIQDDPQDLNREMAKMGDIYHNSTVTIFAGKGPHSSSGLFALRNGPFYKPCNVHINTIECGEPRKTEVAFVSRDYDHDNPLAKRGWVRKSPQTYQI